MEVVSAITNFDTMHDGDGDYKEKAAVEYKPLLFWLYVTIKASVEDGLKKIEIQPCVKVDLVESSGKIESNVLTQAVDSNASFSQFITAPPEHLAVASKSTQQTISK